MRLRITFAVAALALAVGVTAAWAGFPHFKSTDATLEEGTTTKGGGKKSTSTVALATEVATADATSASSNTNVVPAKITITYSGTAFNTLDVVKARIAGYAKWACFNNGSNIPADGNTSKSPNQSIALSSEDGELAVRNGKASGEFEIILTPSASALESVTCQGTQSIALYSLRYATADEMSSFPNVAYPFEIWAETAQGAGGYTEVSTDDIPFCREPGNPACFS